MYSQSDVLEAVMQGLPYPQHVSGIDLNTEPGSAVRFMWMHDRFRVSLSSGSVEECKGGCLHRSNLAILFEHLLKMALLKIAVERENTSPNK